ncbi:MAG: threonine/serine dehydratase [Nannocystaceae bacterium]|nr:threonine/serine dehydratase [Nannocystaceae bacterium]
MSVAHVRAAAEQIAGRVLQTPVIRHAALDHAAGAELWLKAENLQHIGAFKARGAMYAVSRLETTARNRGVVTYSSGNHAQAVALAAKSYGIDATIVMPTDAPKIKVAGVRELGGDVIFSGTTSDERKATAAEIAARSGGTIIEPFDHPDIVAGAGTATLELHAQVAAAGSLPLDALLVPVGGGGLLAGACMATENRDTAIYAVEPAGCDSMGQSLAAGERVAVPPVPTIGDGLKPVSVGALNFEIAKHRVDRGIVVDDEAMGRTLVRLLISANVLVEPSGAAALSVALDRRLPRPARRIGVILSGGNIEPSQLAQLIAKYGDAT